jgi:hypothetical protein
MLKPPRKITANAPDAEPRGAGVRKRQKVEILELLSRNNPAMQVGMPIVELLRVNYWLKLRDRASKSVRLRTRMAGMVVAPDDITFYLGENHVAVE